MFNSTEYTDQLVELSFRATDVPTAQEQVFGFLLDEAGEPATELAVRESLELPKTTTHVALSALVEQGLAKEERVGRTGLYSIDPGDPLVKTLKTARAIRRVQIAIRPVLDELDLVILFGSASRGDNHRNSDVDVFVVARDAERLLTELARHQWLQPVVKTPEAHMQLIADAGTFSKEVARGITIWERR
jgi:predicted nucleotidyltransferase